MSGGSPPRAFTGSGEPCAVRGRGSQGQLAGTLDALGLMIKANSFGDYFTLLCHESTCLSEKGKKLGYPASLLSA
jgi:hypothetical protein